MRLIDADEMCELCGEPNPIKCSNCKVPQMGEIEAVLVVRCKDCKHRVDWHLPDYIDDLGMCLCVDKLVAPNHFCAYGELKEESC